MPGVGMSAYTMEIRAFSNKRFPRPGFSLHKDGNKGPGEVNGNSKGADCIY